jgi:hypothetical protein
LTDWIELSGRSDCRVRSLVPKSILEHCSPFLGLSRKKRLVSRPSLASALVPHASFRFKAFLKVRCAEICFTGSLRITIWSRHVVSNDWCCVGECAAFWSLRRRTGSSACKIRRHPQLGQYIHRRKCVWLDQQLRKLPYGASKNQTPESGNRRPGVDQHV